MQGEEPGCDGSYWGYVRCDVNRWRWKTTFKGVPTDPTNGSVLTPDVPSPIKAVFVVEDGQPGAVQDGQTTTGSSYEGESAPFDPDKLN